MAAKTPNLTTGLSLGPTFPIEQESDFPGSHRTMFEDGTTQAWQTSSRKERHWHLVYAPVTTAERAEILAYFDARQGPYGLHYFDHIGLAENDIPVRFVGKPRSSWIAPGVWSVELDIEEVKE